MQPSSSLAFARLHATPPAAAAEAAVEAEVAAEVEAAARADFFLHFDALDTCSTSSRSSCG